jgi:predicted RNase H-like HicB family nuclease
MRVLIIVERTATGFSSYAPDLPGCIATGPTREDIERQMKEAVEFHLEGLRAQGASVPASNSYAFEVEVAA